MKFGKCQTRRPGAALGWGPFGKEIHASQEVGVGGWGGSSKGKYWKCPGWKNSDYLSKLSGRVKGRKAV